MEKKVLEGTSTLLPVKFRDAKLYCVPFIVTTNNTPWRTCPRRPGSKNGKVRKLALHPRAQRFQSAHSPQGVVGLHAHQSGLFKSIQDQAALRPASVCHALVSLFGHAWQKTSLETLLQKVRYLCGHENNQLDEFQCDQIVPASSDSSGIKRYYQDKKPETIVISDEEIELSPWVFNLDIMA